MLGRLKAVNPAEVLKAVVVPFAIGWLVALAFGLLIAKLQYDALDGVFSGERLAAEYQARIDHVLMQGPLLWVPQMAVIAGLLTWQVGRLGRRSARPLYLGISAGIVLALIEVGIALGMQVPVLLVVVMGIIVVGAGVFAGWSASGPLQASKLTENTEKLT